MHHIADNSKPNPHSKYLSERNDYTGQSDWILTSSLENEICHLLWRTAVWALLLTGHKGANCANQSNCSTVWILFSDGYTVDAQLRSISVLFEHWVFCNYAVSASNKNFPWVETMHARICWSPKAKWALCVSPIIVEDTVCSMELKLIVTGSSKIAGNCWTTTCWKLLNNNTATCRSLTHVQESDPRAGVWSCMLDLQP